MDNKGATDIFKLILCFSKNHFELYKGNINYK